MTEMSSDTVSRILDGSMVQSFTVISNSFPIRSPIWMALAPLYTSLISTSLR